MKYTNEERVRMTREMITSPELSAGITLALAALMDKFGLIEFTMDPDEFPVERLDGIDLERTADNKLIVRIVPVTQ